LFEAALALGLGLALIGLMLAFYRQILTVRTSIMDEMDLVKSKRLIMEGLTDALRSAVPQQGGLSGDEHRVRITTARVPGPAVWTETTVTEAPLPPEADLGRIIYRLRLADDEYGQPYIAGLERVRRRVLRAEVIEEGVGENAVLLSERIKFLYLRYWDGAAWLPNWGGGDVPAAVEINLGVKPLPEDTDPEDYPWETQRRVVYVPAGTRAQGGTVGRGLDAGGPGGRGGFGR
jgi:hypothetical protein